MAAGASPLRQSTFVVDKRTTVKPKVKHKPTKRDIQTAVGLESDEEENTEDNDEEVEFTGSSPAKLQGRRVSLRKKKPSMFPEHRKPTIKDGSRKPQHGLPLHPVDPETYGQHKADPPRKKPTDPYGSFAGHDSLSGPPSSSNTLQQSTRRQHPQVDSNGTRHSSAMPSFARQAANAALGVVNTVPGRRAPPQRRDNDQPAKIHSSSTRKPPSSNTSTQGPNASYMIGKEPRKIKGLSNDLDKGKGKASTIEIPDSDDEDDIENADDDFNQASTSQKKLHSSASKVIQPGVVRKAKNQLERSQANKNQTHSSPAHGATEEEDEIGIPVGNRGNRGLVSKMQAKPAESSQMGSLPKATKKNQLICHLNIKLLASEALGTDKTARLVINGDRLCLETHNKARSAHFGRDEVFSVQLSRSSSAVLKHDEVAFAVLTIDDARVLKNLGAHEETRFYLEFDKAHGDWEDKGYIQLFEALKPRNKGDRPLTDFITCEAFKLQQEALLQRLSSSGPAKSSFTSQISTQDVTAAGRAAEARRAAANASKSNTTSEWAAPKPKQPDKPVKKKADAYVELTDEEDKRLETVSSDDDAEPVPVRQTRAGNKDTSREASGDPATRPTNTRPRARPSIGALRRDSERNGEDLDSVTVAASRTGKRKQQQVDTAIDDTDFYESKPARGPKSKDDATFRSTAKATSDGTSRTTRQQGDGNNRRSTSAPIVKPREKWHSIGEGPDDEVILVYPPEGSGSISITKGDFDRLQPDEYLNDTLVEFGMKQVWEKLADNDNPAEKELANQIHIFSSFFYKKLSAKSVSKDKNKTPVDAYSTVRKWTAKFDLFSKKYIFMPINENFHWYLAVIINPGAVLRPPPTSVDQDTDLTVEPSASLKAGLSPDKQSTRVTSPYFAKGRTDADGESRGLDSAKMDLDEPDSATEAKSDTAEEHSTKAGTPLDEVVTTQQDAKPQKAHEAPEVDVAKSTAADTAASVGTITQDAVDQEDMCYIITLDSLGGKHKAVHDKLKAYLKREAVDKGKADEDHVYIGPPNVEAINGNCSEQHNFSDCGLYVMHFTEKLLESREEIVPFLTKKVIPSTVKNQKPKGALQTEEMVNELWAREEAMVRRKVLAKDIRQLHQLWLARREARMEEKKARRQARLQAAQEQAGAAGEGGTAADDFTSTSEEEGGDSDVEIVEKAKTPSPAKSKRKTKKKVIEQSASSGSESDHGSDSKLPNILQNRPRQPSVPVPKVDTSNIIVEVTMRPSTSSIPASSLPQQTAKTKSQRSGSPVKVAPAAPSIDLDDEADELESSPAPVPASETTMDIDPANESIMHPLSIETERMSLDTEPSGSEGVDDDDEEEEEEESKAEAVRSSQSTDRKPSQRRVVGLNCEVSPPAETSATTHSTSTSTSGSSSSSTSEDENEVSAVTDANSSAFPYKVMSPEGQSRSRTQSSSSSEAGAGILCSLRANSASQPDNSASKLRAVVAEHDLETRSSKSPNNRKEQKRPRPVSVDPHEDIDILIGAPTRKRSRQESPPPPPPPPNRYTFADPPIKVHKPSTSPAPPVASTSSSSFPTFHTPNGGNKDQPIDIGDSDEETTKPTPGKTVSTSKASKLKGETSASLLASVAKTGLAGDLKRNSAKGYEILDTFHQRPNSSQPATNGVPSSPKTGTHTRFAK